MNHIEINRVITFACPDCNSGHCYKIETLPNFFKCDSCKGEHFFTEKTINFIVKAKKDRLVLPKEINIKRRGSSPNSTL